MKREPKVDQNSRLLYVLLRYDMDLDQAGFSALTRTTPGQVSIYDRGLRTVPEAVLERAADATGFPRSLLQPARRAIRSFRAAARGWSRADRALAEMFFSEVLALSGAALNAVVTAAAPEAGQWIPATGTNDRDLAAQLWQRLERRNERQRLALVEEIEDFRSAALCELVAAKSIKAAPRAPSEALELAELALRIAELCPGDEALRQQSQGYAWFHIANALRVTSDFPGANEALETAKRLWEAGAKSAPGFFNEAIVLALEANLHREQGRFAEASIRIEEALAADRSELRTRLLLTKSQILETLGEIESSMEVLREAILCVDEDREPRIAFALRFQFLVNLCLQDRAVEAIPGLPTVRTLAERVDQTMDSVRLVWLEGKVAAGTGRTGEAESAYKQVRSKFASHEPPLAFDYALVSLDLSLLLLEQGRPSEVRTLGEETLWIFNSQGIHREALAALQIFCEAASREAATVELTQRVIRFLRRSQHDPELRFEANMEAEAS